MSPLDGQQDNDIVSTSFGDKAHWVYRRSDAGEGRHRLTETGAHIADRRQQPTLCRYANVHVARPVVVTSALVLGVMEYRRPLCADIVAKVENRTMPKISRKRIFRRLCRCNTP
jgi:hypothetical protein